MTQTFVSYFLARMVTDRKIAMYAMGRCTKFQMPVDQRRETETFDFEELEEIMPEHHHRSNCSVTLNQKTFISPCNRFFLYFFLFFISSDSPASPSLPGLPQYTLEAFKSSLTAARSLPASAERFSC